MFGTETTGRHLGLRRACRSAAAPLSSQRPYGSYFDEIADSLGRGLERDGAGFDDAVEQVVVDRGELTLHVRREHLVEVGQALRDDPRSLSSCALGSRGVHYPWRPAANCTPSTTCSRSPTTGGCGWR